MHLACRQDDAVPDGFFETAERLLNGCVGDTDAGVAREQDKINAQLLGPQSVLHRGPTPGGHGPHGVRLDLRVIRHGLQIDADGPSGELFQQADGLPRFHRRQAVDNRLLHIKQIQQQDIRPHGGRKLRVGHIAQQRLHRTDGLAGNDPALALLDGLQQVSLGELRKIRSAAIQHSFCHSGFSLFVFLLLYDRAGGFYKTNKKNHPIITGWPDWLGMRESNSHK